MTSSVWTLYATTQLLVKCAAAGSDGLHVV